MSCVALKSENPESVIAEAEYRQRHNVAVVSDTEMGESVGLKLFFFLL